MGHKFADIAFTPAVRAVQEQRGSRSLYASLDTPLEHHHELSETEANFITARDSFYLATVSETGWPYVQHRGGPVGFVKVLNNTTLGFAEYRGNRQYVTTGNLQHSQKVSLFFMDYPNRTRLKLLGYMQPLPIEQAEMLSQLEDSHYRARVEHGMIIHVAAFDWNCPQHITPRYSQAEVDEQIHALQQEIKRLRGARE